MNIESKIINLVVKQALNKKIHKRDLEGISKEYLDRIKTSFDNFTFKFCIAGKQGLGKSSTLNALFGLNLPVEHGVDIDGTNEVLSHEEEVTILPLDFGEGKGKIIIYDLPGMQSSPEKDKSLLKDYNRIIPKCDIILWVVQPDNNQLTFDINFINSLPTNIKNKIVVGISKIDKIFPENWNGRKRKPSVEQEKSIKKKKVLLSKKFGINQDRIIEYCARRRIIIDGKTILTTRKYNLLQLCSKILKLSSHEHGFLFYSLLSESILKKIDKAMKLQNKK